MSTLGQIFPQHALDQAIDAGHVRAQTHPELPLTIYNYTETCAFSNAWTEVTLACRGLIVAVEIATGRSFGPAAVPSWPGPVVESFSYPTFGAALGAPPRNGKEGLVIHITSSNARLKIKYEEYVHLHRIITGLSARRVWEALGAGSTVDEIAAPLPDEFHEWVRDLAARLHSEADAVEASVEAAFADILKGLGDGWSRKDFALIAAQHPLRGFLFARLDSKPIRAAIWEQVKPAGDETPHGLAMEDE